MEEHKHPHHVMRKKKWSQYSGKYLPLIAVGILLTGLPIWFTSYHTYTNSKTIWFSSLILLFIDCFALVLFFSVTAKRIILSGSIAFLLAVFIKIVIDTSIDSTTHNLMPFELGSAFIMALIIATVSVALATVVKIVLKLK